MRFMEYEAAAAVPNVVVDGSPNAGTVLALTHWPGFPQPAGHEFDLSAQMAFAFARRGEPVAADVVTNNHFDQDGLVSVLALVDPEAALAHERLLIDVASAGDFATFSDRRSARASMALAAFADPARSPIGSELSGDYAHQCGVLYERLLPVTVELAEHPERWRDLWADEDAHLAASEAALANGSVTIDELPEVELAVVTVHDRHGGASHRFSIAGESTVHPMALHGATSCRRLLVVDDSSYTYTDRYETWVQFRSRPPLLRVDLRPLAELLTSVDDGVAWSADVPGSLTPELRSDAASSLPPGAVIDHVVAHLSAAPAAWDPYRSHPAPISD